MRGVERGRSAVSTAGSLRRVEPRGVGGKPLGGTLSMLDNRSTNIGIAAGKASELTVLGDVHIHNAASVVNNGSPLMVVSKIASSVTALSAVCPTSVRDFAVLGGTARATVCNSHNTSNMVRVGAGGKAKQNFRVSCSNGCKFRSVCGRLRVLGNPRCVTATRTLKLSCGGNNCGAGFRSMVAHANLVRRRRLTFDNNSRGSGCQTSFNFVSRGAVIGIGSCQGLIMGLSTARGTFSNHLINSFNMCNCSSGVRSVFSAQVLFCSTTTRGPACPTKASIGNG